MRILPALTCRISRTTFTESLELLAFPGIQTFAVDWVTVDRIRIQLNVTHWSIENGNIILV
jgi:hypothetical protein